MIWLNLITQRLLDKSNFLYVYVPDTSLYHFRQETTLRAKYFIREGMLSSRSSKLLIKSNFESISDTCFYHLLQGTTSEAKYFIGEGMLFTRVSILVMRQMLLVA